MITGGHPLEGIAPVHGAKNSALPILAATLLAKGESVIHNCPDLTDVQTALDILTCLGCRVRREGDTVMVDTSCAQGTRIPDHLMSRMRASVLFLGALLAREGCAEAGWPGGCALGARPIDLHLAAFQTLGARVEEGADFLTIRGVDSLKGNVALDCRNDHRIAMMAAIAATKCTGPVTLTGAECVNKSYPDFWDHYRMLGGELDVLISG